MPRAGLHNDYKKDTAIMGTSSISQLLSGGLSCLQDQLSPAIGA